MKFALEWIGDRVAIADAGGTDGVRRLLDRAGLPVESAEGEGEGVVLDVEITPNRPDAMSHRGLAREVAAMAGIPFRETSDEPELAASGPSVEELASVEIAVPRLGRRFGARVVRWIANAPSSPKVRGRLAAIGAKSIDAAVDATNYALWDLGQPLHAFDLDKLTGGRIVVRKAKRGEKLVTLDGVERALELSDVVVADGQRPISLAGIMGGLDTAVSSATKNVLLEAAWWDPVAVRRTSRRLGMHTDASHRFERGADPERIPAALDLAARLLLEAAGGTLAPGLIDARGSALPRRRVVLRLDRLRMLAGDPRLDLDFAAEALARLGFSIATRSARRLTAEVPSYRPDVSIEEDLVEEVLRVWGYDRLPSRLPATAGAGGHLEPRRIIEDALSDRAVSAGLHETYSYPFADRESDESAFAPWLEATGIAREPLTLANPVDASKPNLRATLLPAILDAASRNFRHGAREVGLFEVGRAFGLDGDPSQPDTFESRRFAFALGGEARPHWSAPADSRGTDFHDAKGLFERLLERWVPAEEQAWKVFDAPAFVAGAAARCETREGVLLGVVGVVGKAEREKRRLPDGVSAGEILVDAIPRDARAVRFRPFSLFPPVVADLSISLPAAIAWESVDRFARGLGLANLESLRLFDRYTGPGDSDGQVKTTVRLTYPSADRTLEQEEVNAERDRLAASLRTEFGAES
jgi:phenylalanyl-tRNA synthetase beta chain